MNHSLFLFKTHHTPSLLSIQQNAKCPPPYKRTKEVKLFKLKIINIAYYRTTYTPTKNTREKLRVELGCLEGQALSASRMKLFRGIPYASQVNCVYIKNVRLHLPTYIPIKFTTRFQIFFLTSAAALNGSQQLPHKGLREPAMSKDGMDGITLYYCTASFSLNTFVKRMTVISIYTDLQENRICLIEQFIPPPLRSNNTSRHQIGGEQEVLRKGNPYLLNMGHQSCYSCYKRFIVEIILGTTSSGIPDQLRFQQNSNRKHMIIQGFLFYKCHQGLCRIAKSIVNTYFLYYAVYVM